ncbi:unnamed protein product [Eruca vesicaria subsp. sativa]|uniref:C2H2-type domain-containing protein n=1 Tax=Eruca vesicaria subsp. sativa TaxID=29727 RepID=A0ABC8KLH4_ERUVS|nr:unnamed protein product [Eruca vesicaria subsp. sativa]
MKRTRDDHPSHFLHQSSVYDDADADDDYSSSSESGGFQPQPLSPQPQKHFCVICSKQFSSGKAYGGHVRIHSSEYNNKGKTKKMKLKKRKIGLVNKEKEKQKKIDLIRADVEGKIRCCLCRKEFQTMHSLFGHMRRHPDRNWKGIRPPPPEKLNLSFLDDEDEDDDDEVMSRSIMMSGVTVDVQKAACCLMMLNCDTRKAAMGTGNSKVRTPRDGEMDVEGSTVDMKVKMEIEVNVNNPQSEAKKSSLGFDLNQPCHDSY